MSLLWDGPDPHDCNCDACRYVEWLERDDELTAEELALMEAAGIDDDGDDYYNPMDPLGYLEPKR
jgi:hypothetical protein